MSFALSLMISRAELVHRIDHDTGMLGTYLGMDTVTKIEHMAMAMAIALQHTLHFHSDLRGRRVQYVGIKIAL